MGHKRLVKALAELYSPIINHKIDWESEILITNGAYGGLYSAIQGLINPDDEVIIIEPYFDCYEPMVKHAGGKPIFIPLRQVKITENKFYQIKSNLLYIQKKAEYPIISSDIFLDYDELSSAITNKTKLLIFNNPNNPVGKVRIFMKITKINILNVNLFYIYCTKTYLDS